MSERPQNLDRVQTTCADMVTESRPNSSHAELRPRETQGRNLVVCCDGTRNKFGVRNTNVVRLCMALERNPKLVQLFYDPGVGTIGRQTALTKFRRFLSKVIDGAIGRTIDDNIAEAYCFLMDQFQPNDKVFLFGFSRGAYTVRALAGMLHMYGLLGPGSSNLVPYIIGMYRRTDDETEDQFFDIAREFKSTFSREVPIHFLGVWDTVSSVGWFWDPKSLAWTKRNPLIKHLRHAVALDEQRAFFRTNLLGAPYAHQDKKEVWFPGVHSDVGGGYADSNSGLSQVALEWMLNEAIDCGLRVNHAMVSEILGGRRPFIKPDPYAPKNKSLKGLWHLAELVPKLSWSENAKKRRLRMNRWKRRFVPHGAIIHTPASPPLSDQCGSKQ